MSYDTSGNGDKLTGQFSAGLVEPFSIVAWTKKTAAQWAATSDDKLVHLNDDTVDLNSSHGIINRGTADEVSAASWRESDAARAQASEGFADGTYDDTWVLVVAVFNTDSDRTIYIENSANKTNDTGTRATNAVDEIAVGGATQSDFQQWAGLTGEVAIFDIALTDAHVDALQTAAEVGIAPNTIAPDDCVGYWPLLRDQAAHPDQSGNSGPTLTVQSAAPFSSDHPIILHSDVTVGSTKTASRLSIFAANMPKPSNVSHTIDAGATLVVVDVWTAGNETAQNDADFSVVWDTAGVNEALTRVHLPTRTSKTENDPHVQTWALLNPTAKAANMTFDLESTSEYTNVIVHITNYLGTVTDSLGRAISFVADDVNLVDTDTCDILSGGKTGNLLHAICAFKGVDTDPLTLSSGWASASTKYDEATGVADWATHLANKDAPSAITWDADGSDPDENNMGVMFEIAPPGFKIDHIMVNDEERYFRQNSSWGAFSSSLSAIQGSELEPYSDYLFFYNCGLNGTNTAVSAFEWRMRENTGPGSERPYSRAQLEPRRINGYDNHPYMFMERYQTGSVPNDFRWQGKGNGTNGQRSGFFHACAIRLDDLSVDDFAYDEDTTLLNSLNNTGWTDGASVTIGNGSDDYLILATCYIDVDSNNTEIRMRVDVGGTPANHIAVEGEDGTDEKYCLGMVQYLAAPAADTVVKNQFQTNSSTAGLMDADNNRIFALRLNAFEDYVGLRDASDTNIDAIDTDIVVATMAHTTNTAMARDWAFFAMSVHDTVDARQIRREIADTGGEGSIAGGTPNTQSIAMMTNHGDTSENPITLIGELTSVVNATALDIDFTVEEDQDVTPETVMVDTHMVGFPWELAGLPAEPSFVASATSSRGGTAGTPSTVVIPAHNDGDKLVIMIMTTSAPTPAVAINTPSGWTKEEDVEAGDNSAVRLTCFTKPGNGSETSVDITLSGDVVHGFAASCKAYSGASTTLDISGTATQETGVNMTAPSVTTTVPNTRIVYGFCFDDDIATEADVITNAGFNGVLRGFEVSADAGGDGNGGVVGTSDEHQAASGASNTCVFSTLADSDAGCAITIALAPVGLNNIAELPSATLTLTPNAPSAIATEKHIADLPSATLTLAAFASSAATTENNFAAIAAAAILTLAPFAPDAITTENNIATLPGATLTLSPFAPSTVVTENNVATLPGATLTLTPFAPSVITTEANFADLPSATLTLTPNAPSVVSTENRIASLPSATLTLAPFAPTVETFDPNTVELPSATLTLTPFAPDAVSTENNFADLPSTTLTLTSFAPSVVTTENNFADLPSQTLTLSPFAPDAITTEANFAVLPSATLALTPFAPSAVATDNNFADLSSATLALTPFAPSVVTTENNVAGLPSTTLTLTPFVPQAVTTEANFAELPSATLTLSSFVPSVITTEANFAELPSAALTLAPFPPSVVTTENKVADLPSATLTLTPFALEAVTTENNFAELPSATLTLTPFALQAITTENRIADLPSATLTLTPFAPTVESSTSNIATLPSATLTLASFAPSAVVTEKHIADLSSAALTLTPFVPSVVTTEANFAVLPGATLTLAPFAPDVIASENNFADLPSATLTLTPFASSVVSTEKHIANLPSQTLTLTPFAPVVFRTVNILDSTHSPDVLDLTDLHEFL